jgi:hypothetical protein
MRKSAAILAIILLLCPLMAAYIAHADEPVIMTEAIVSNPNPEDRLNLRAKPDERSKSLGKYYNGTRIQVLKSVDLEWVKARIGYTDSGYLDGYMMREYLAFPGSAETIEPAFPMMRCMAKGGFTLLTKPDKSANHVSYSSSEEACFHIETIITVLGVLPNGWSHVSVAVYDAGNLRADDGGNVALTGFIKLNRLTLLRDSGGKTNHAVIKYDPAQKHPFSKAELDAAAAIILERFESNYIGCILDRLWYSEAQSDEILTNDSIKEVSPEWIVFLSDFHTLPGSEESGFDPNSRYKGWMWFLHRPDRESPWEINNWGLY